MSKTDTFDMRIVHKQTEAERHNEYRQREGDSYRVRNAERMRAARALEIPEFIGVDSEGIGRGRNHRAVLLGVGSESYIASDMRRGLQWEEIFQFLYQQFREHPKAAFVGFYLSYDFNQWLRTLSLPAARSLLTPEGIAARKVQKQGVSRRHSNPVKVGRWEIDMLGTRRLSLRPRPEGCFCYERAVKCEHKHAPWLHVCDAGSFYQMSFLATIDPARWGKDGAPCTQAEYAKILHGKNSLRTLTRWDDRLIEYNTLENIVLARVMEKLAKGFLKIGIKLSKDQWYGPGASASRWLWQNKAPRRTELTQKQGKKRPLLKRYFWDAARKSYFGGWFEIFSHGLIRGSSHNYDINNAYPYAATKLPHICGACDCRRGKGEYKGSGQYVLVYATVFTRGDRIGAVPYRDSEGGILRPAISKGWYWQFEIDAAARAGLVKKVMTHEWAEFIPCNHPPPFSDIERLYYIRLEAGKDTAQGMAIKLNNNSIYGKFAQSVGSAPYNNWFYASYITAHCRVQILDAIATHPGGVDSVLMVATDGICFDSPHPALSVSKRLGEWAYTEYTDLCLFKPGVYWHREGKEALLKVKSRGVPRVAFAQAVEAVQLQFDLVHREGMFPGTMLDEIALDEGFDAADLRTEKGWPYFYVPVNFRLKSCKQALNEGNWKTAGTLQHKVLLRQDSDPQSKRRKPWYNWEKRRIDTVIHDLPIKQLETKYHGDVKIEVMDIGIGYDGNAESGILEAAAILRNKPANYNLPLGEEIEWINVWGG